MSVVERNAMSRLLPAVVLVAVLSACGPGELRVTMKPDNNSGQSGFAVITQGQGGKVHVVLDVVAIGTAAQLVHIHANSTCGEISTPKYQLISPTPKPDDPTRIVSESDASDSAEGPLQFKDLSKGGYVINMHFPTDNSVYTSCGEVPVP